MAEQQMAEQQLPQNPMSANSPNNEHTMVSQQASGSLQKLQPTAIKRREPSSTKPESLRAPVSSLNGHTAGTRLNGRPKWILTSSSRRTTASRDIHRPGARFSRARDQKAQAYSIRRPFQCHLTSSKCGVDVAALQSARGNHERATRFTEAQGERRG